MASEAVVENLQKSLPSKVFRPGTQVYDESLKSYFTAQQAELTPTCIVKPVSAEDVALAIRILAEADDSILLAVRSGGHNPSKGSSNIQGGVTVDLRDVKSIDIHESKQRVTVGTGAIWGHVYEKLEPLGLGVVGAQVYNVGVGGFILGGGLSSLSPRFGFACDMVEDFEIVLASGEVVHANREYNNDLWPALKGGSNNFGIITSFTLKCFPESRIWGGLIVAPITALDSNLKSLADMDAKWDVNASLKQSFTFNSKTKYMIATNLEYTNDVPEPEVLKPFLETKPLYRNTTKSTTFSELAMEHQKLHAGSTRQTFCTTSFKISLQHLHDVVEIYKNQVATVETLTDLKITLTYLRLHGAIPAYGVENGGNATGLPADTAPLVFAILTCSWSQISDDSAMDALAQRFIKEVDALSIKKGLYHPFIYPNYAGGFQNPMTGYTQKSQQMLEAMSLKYDPAQFFKKRVHGGFKIADQ